MAAVSLNASSASIASPARWLAVPELEEHLRAPGRVLDAQLQRGAQPRRRLVERDRGARRRGGPDVVLDAALGIVQGRGSGEVVREVGQRAARATLGALERLAHAQVHLRAPHRGEPVVERPADELVREPIGQAARRQLLDHAAADGLVERGEQVALAQARGLSDDVQAELRSGGSRELQELGRGGRQAREPLADHLAHALRGAELRQRPGGPDARRRRPPRCRSPPGRAIARRPGRGCPR